MGGHDNRAISKADRNLDRKSHVIDLVSASSAPNEGAICRTVDAIRLP
jgi:hypothetical protein